VEVTTSQYKAVRNKDEAFCEFSSLRTRMQNGKGLSIKIRRDHGKEFKNAEFKEFYKTHDVKYEFSFPQESKELLRERTELYKRWKET